MLNSNFDLSYYLKPKIIFQNYFLLISLTALMNMITGKSYLYTISFPIIVIYMIYVNKRRITFNIIDVLWIVNFVWMLLTWLFNDYEHKGTLIMKCIQTQIIFMLTYWIARKYSRNYLKSIIEKSYIPLLFMCVIGIWLFFSPPQWYTAAINKVLEAKFSGQQLRESMLEFYRLRSIFPTTYALTYFVNVVVIYQWFLIVKRKYLFNSKTYHYLYIVLLISTSFFAMMRAPFFSAGIALVIALYYNFRYNKHSEGLSVFVYLGISVSIVVVVAAFLNSNEMTEFITNKYGAVTDKNSDFVTNRFFFHKIEYTLLGDGVGRHSIYANNLPHAYSLPDGEYMKLIAEQGYIGLVLFLVMFGVALVKSIVHFKYLYFEFCLLIMLFICMIGADPISTYDKHPFIFWLALGNISKFDNDKLTKLWRNRLFQKLSISHGLVENHIRK